MSDNATPQTSAAPRWPSGIQAITLFVEDIAAAKQFYGDVFELPVLFEDEVSAVFDFGTTIINLLQVSAAHDLVAPASPASPKVGVRMQLTIRVDNVEETCNLLADRGVELLNGPMDRPWGIRTAAFRDPGGHVWEIACDL